MERFCLDCGEKLVGRIDKKFCSDQCRNQYNNHINRADNKLVRQINQVLHKNRRILKELNPDGKVRLHRKRLASKGFNFNYHTHIYTTKTGNQYFFCYEYGYLALENDYYALVIRREE